MHRRSCACANYNRARTFLSDVVRVRESWLEIHRGTGRRRERAAYIERVDRRVSLRSRDSLDDSPSTPDANVTPAVCAAIRFFSQYREATRAVRTRVPGFLSRVPPNSRSSASVSFAARTDVRRSLQASDVPGYARRAYARRGGSANGGTTSGRKSGRAARGSRRVLVRWYRVVPQPPARSAVPAAVVEFSRRNLGETSSRTSTGKYVQRDEGAGDAEIGAFALCVSRGYRDATT